VVAHAQFHSHRNVLDALELSGDSGERQGGRILGFKVSIHASWRQPSISDNYQPLIIAQLSRELKHSAPMTCEWSAGPCC